jgi:hypothetical protein
MTKRLALAQHAYDLDALICLMKTELPSDSYALATARTLHSQAKAKLDLNAKIEGLK